MTTDAANLAQDIKRDLDDLEGRLASLEGPLAIAEKKLRITDIDERMQEPGFWDDQAKASGLQRERTTIEGEVARFDAAKRLLSDSKELLEMAADDASALTDIKRDVDGLNETVRRIELSRMLRGEQDKNNAILSVNVGTGGADANEFTEMLLRMYTRYAEKRGYAVEAMDLSPGDSAGLKSATILVKGEYAYGFLKAEIGVHRLVRMSPFSGKRETSFASVWVLPEVDDDIDIEVKPDDLEWITMRSGGAGGQHVNKTESAVQVTHVPSGIIVRCQQERSQIKNRALAMKILKSRLFDLEMKRRLAEKDKAEAEKMVASFGSQIRNYVLAPYRLAKDLRSGHEVGNVDAVLDGDLQPFIEAYLLHEDDQRRAQAKQ
jgi:peptide chain release factor 2